MQSSQRLEFQKRLRVRCWSARSGIRAKPCKQSLCHQICWPQSAKTNQINTWSKSSTVNRVTVSAKSLRSSRCLTANTFSALSVSRPMLKRSSTKARTVSRLGAQNRAARSLCPSKSSDKSCRHTCCNGTRNSRLSRSCLKTNKWGTARVRVATSWLRCLPLSQVTASANAEKASASSAQRMRTSQLTVAHCRSGKSLLMSMTRCKRRML